MKTLCKIGVILVLFSLAPSLMAKVQFAAGGLTLGLSAGYVPDLFHLAESNDKLASQNINILNKIQKINNLYDSSSYGEKNVIRDFTYSGNELAAYPLQVSLKYSWYGIFMRLGFIYYSVPIDTKSYVMTTGATTSRKVTAVSGSNTLYQDIAELYDDESLNDEALALGLRSTYGQPVRFIQYLTADRIEIPVSFGISMFDLGPASFFFGGGFTFYYGKKSRVITAQALTENPDNSDFFQDDIDVFTATHIGFHIMTGAEYRLVRNVGLTFELTLSFGTSNPTVDSYRTGAFTNNSLFHANDANDFGGTERSTDVLIEKSIGTADALQSGRGLERTDSIDFGEFRVMVGFNYHIVRNDEDKSQLRSSE